MDLFDRLWKRVWPDGGSRLDEVPSRAERGSVSIQIAIAMTVLIGMAALGVEVSYLLLTHRQMQSAADAAALAGTDALAAGDTDDIVVEGQAVAAQNGFTNGATKGTNGVVAVTISNPPTTGPYAGNTSAVQATVSEPQAVSLMQQFRSGNVGVSATAVALVQPSGKYCSLALDPSAGSALSLSNNAVVTNPNCGVAVNSSSSSAINLSNNAVIRGPVLDHGGASLSNNAALTNASVILYGPVTADPYASVALQTPPSCTGQSGSASNNATVNLTAGHFCSGWSFSNNVTANLAAGIYYVDTKLTVSNNVTVNGMGGVTIVVNGTYAISIGNNVAMNLTAPTSGNYAGIALFGPRNSTPAVNQTFGNNVLLNVTGAIYFPSQTITMSNNGNIGAAQCTQVIADKIRVSNNVTLDNNCSGTGVRPIGATTRLVQ